MADPATHPVEHGLNAGISGGALRIGRRSLIVPAGQAQGHVQAQGPGFEREDAQ